MADARDLSQAPRYRAAGDADAGGGASLGLAMFHDAGASRVERRSERPYEHVVKLDAGGADQPQSFDLRLEGRIASFADGAAIRCWSESAEHRPTCLFAVELDRVAFEDAKGAVLADWPR